MEHNKLYQALENKAIRAEKSKIESAITNFVSAIRHPNGSTLGNKKISINIDGENIGIGIQTFLWAVKKHLVDERKKSLVDREITSFMNAQANYAKGLKNLEQYLEVEDYEKD